MDSVKFQLSNKEYFIEFSKIKKIKSFSDKSDYTMHIKFINNINQIILDIDCNEMDYFKAIQNIDYLNQNIMQEYGDVLYFQSKESLYTINIGLKDNDIFLNDDSKLEDPMTFYKISMYYILITEFNNIYGNKNRLYTEISLEDLEIILYNMYLVIEDLPYLEQLNFSFINDMMAGE